MKNLGFSFRARTAAFSNSRGDPHANRRLLQDLDR